ncbi:MAG: GGDEF domain-containing protein [Cellvibrionaceae bacterium]|nr:GGDEF domain-containing protein [Cellvibrionaceae bacterium]|tara:strand:- start:25833 stop:26906 length:1074 start_codon:yes stop_codon:yes gene_type:complete
MTIRHGDPTIDTDILDHQKLLESIVDITCSPDRQAIERALVVALVTNIPCLRAAVVPKPFDDRDALREFVALNRSRFNDDLHQGWNLDELAHEMLPPLRKALGGEASVDRTDAGYHYFFPLTDTQNVVASLTVESRRNLEPHLKVVDALLKIYANYLAVLKESESDKLTGLLNRRTFDGKFQALISQQRRHAGQQATVRDQKRTKKEAAHSWLGIIDIDHFKAINDKFGHLYGDEILLLLSQRMQLFFRRADLLFRFGGEEFVVLLEPTDEAGASSAFKRFCETVATFGFPQVNQVTISIGFAPIALDSSSSEVFGHADQALYFAKREGRNQVASYSALIKSGHIQPLTASDDVDLF